MAGIVTGSPQWLAALVSGLVALGGFTTATEAAGSRHEGVATCASTTCHGAARPLGGTPILQNEYVTWSAFDPHAGAFRSLQDERSAAIARRLGIGPADRAPACLACHAEVVPAGDRGPKFQADDGIGCEACHGAAGGWLAAHDDGAPDSRDASLRAGMRALNDARVRGPVCIACHVGNGDRSATHAMMAAGHPRLSFELDTFTELWRTSGGRVHYRLDADYAARKRAAGSTGVWLTGLALASVASVDQVQAAVSRGALPEFAAFNCYSCHRNMGLGHWQDRAPPTGSAPGALRINDSALRLLAIALEPWKPDLAAGLAHGVAALQRAATDDRAGVTPAADVLRRRLAEVVAAVERSPPEPADRRAMLLAVVAGSGKGAYPDYATAEQAAMAAVVLLADGGGPAPRTGDVDALFATLADDAVFDQARFARILGRLRGQSPGRPGSTPGP